MLTFKNYYSKGSLSEASVIRTSMSALLMSCDISFPGRWLFPIIGHMGIAMTSGVIRDFAGPYYVSVSMCKSNVFNWQAVFRHVRILQINGRLI